MAYTVTGSSRTPVGATTGYLTDNPVTGSIIINSGDELLVALVLYSGGTDRTGGAPDFGGYTMIQADTARRGLTSPEVSAEMWYLTASGISLPSLPTTASEITLPNGGGARVVIDMVTAKTKPGKTAGLQVSTGSANATTSTNPYCKITTTAGSTAIFEIVANGANAWAPTARTLNWVNLNDNDIGTYGGGMQYIITDTVGVVTGSWTFGTGEDWGVVMAAFGETDVPIYLQNAVQAQTSSNIDLIQYLPPYLLVLDNSVQVQTSDNIDLSQIYNISIENASQTQTADNLILTAYEPSSQVVPINAIQLQTSDSISLTQNYLLTIYNAVQTQTTNDIVLLQNYLLVAYNAVQTQSTNDITLTQNYVYLLEMYSSTQTQTSDNIMLLQIFILTLMSITQAQTSSNITLGTGGITKQMIHYIMMRRR